MIATRFDTLVRSLERLAPRRAALGMLGGGPAAFLTRFGQDETEAKKKRKKLKKNAFGCVNVGGKCRGKDRACCSGICQGKKPKKGKRDRSRCVAHNVLDCPPGADTCRPGQQISCGTQNVGHCFQTTGGASLCGGGGNCFPCTKDTDCEPDFGPGAACLVCAEACPSTDGLNCRQAAD